MDDPVKPHPLRSFLRACENRKAAAMNVLKDQRRREAGQALVLFILGLVAFIGFVALTIDIGLVFEGRRGQQNAADSAALAGASALPGNATTATLLAPDWS